VKGYSRQYFEDRLDDLSFRRKCGLNRNGYMIMKGLEEIQEDKIYSKELKFTNRNASEVGQTLGALEELYDIEIREEGDPQEGYLWNVGELKEQEGWDTLKNMLHYG